MLFTSITKKEIPVRRSTSVAKGGVQGARASPLAIAV